MIDDCPITGKHPYVSDFRQRVDISVSIPTGQKNSLPGIPCEAADRCALKARVCPKCGKVELYATSVSSADMRKRFQPNIKTGIRSTGCRFSYCSVRLQARFA